MKKLIALSLLTFGFTASFAQVTATATASASIVTPITITKAEDMNFGNIAAGSSVNTVIMNPMGYRSTTGGATLPAATGTVSAASFNITGSGSYTYSITLPSSALILTSGPNSMTVDAFTSSPSSTGTLSTGAQTIYVGATLHVAGSQPSGVYLSPTPFDVTVNYN